MAAPRDRKTTSESTQREAAGLHGLRGSRILRKNGIYKVAKNREDASAMEKIILKWWKGLVGVIIAGMFVWGAYNMYFHQDDLDWFILANRPWSGVMAAPIGDHVNYVWRVLLKTEWDLYGWNFVPYLAVSLAIHAGVIGLLYKLAKLSSGREDLAVMVTLIFAINTNWTETILWISGQTITITALFVLVAMVAIWEKKAEFVWLLLSSWTSALAIGLLLASLAVFKKLSGGIIAILVGLGLIYKMWSTDGTHVAASVAWMIKVIEVWGLMIVNSVVGRLVIPFDRYETLRIGIVSLLMIYGLWRGRGELKVIWRDAWSRFLLLHLGLYNLIVAVGRAQYGVGMMRAERYTYLGLLLVLLLAVRVLRKVKIDKFVWLVPVIVLVQCIGFYHRARTYIERPQQLRNLIVEIRQTESSQIDPEAYLPRFVLNDERLKYRDLLPLLKQPLLKH